MGPPTVGTFFLGGSEEGCPFFKGGSSLSRRLLGKIFFFYSLPFFDRVSRSFALETRTSVEGQCFFLGDKNLGKAFVGVSSFFSTCFLSPFKGPDAASKEKVMPMPSSRVWAYLGV